MTRSHCTVHILLLLLLLMAQTALAGEFKVIPLQHRSAEELVKVVRPLLGKGGQATIYENKLIIKTDAASFASIEDLVRQLDIKRQTLRISVRQDRSKGYVRREGQASGAIGNGRIRVGGGKTLSSRPGVVLGGDQPGDPRVRYSRRLGNMQQSSEQFIQVLDGQQGLITVGQQVPFSRQLAVVTGRYSGVSRTLDFREVSTGFLVRPHLRGDSVTIEITPHMASLPGGAEQTLEFQALTTTVNIPFGVWYNLGGHLQDSDEISRAILAIGTGRGSQSAAVWVKVEK